MTLWKTENSSFESTNILLFLHRWRKPLIIVTAIAIVASVIFSSPFFITPKYKSTVVLYPTATNAISKALLTDKSAVKEDILDFGEDEETEQLLQILHSNRIRDKIISKYQLMQHYDIDTNSGYRITNLHKEYENNITFKRTEYMAVRISALDKDPQTAADIANDIAELLDSTKNEMQKKRAQRAFEIVRDQYFKLRDEIALLEDSLTKLRGFGVHDYESQVEMINQQLAIELAKGNESGITRLENKLEILARYGGPYVSIRDALEHEKKQLSMLRAKYEEAKTDATEVLPSKFIVNSAYKAERKSYPIRWLIVLVTTLSTFLFTLFLLLIIENINSYFPGTFKFAQHYIKHERKKANPKSKDPPGPLQGPPQRAVPDRVEEKKPLPKPPDKKPQEERRKEKKYEEKVNESTPKENSINEDKIKLENTETHDNQMARYFTNTNILRLLLKWKVHLAIIVLLSIIMAVILSSPWFITPKYKSFALVYPSNVEPYSEESESEQMLQFLQSKDIRDQIIQKYDLAKRYKIDSSYKYFQSTIIYEYSKNIMVSKTPFESVKIEVLDSDPVVASNMVEDIIKFYNQKVLNTHKSKYKEVVDFIGERVERKKQEIDSVEKKLYQIRTEYNIIDYPNQSREVARGFLRTVDGDNATQNINTKEVLKLKENIEKYGGIYTYYNDRYFELIAELGKVKMDYDEALMYYNRDVTYANVLSAPFPADKKSYPVRWVIVVLTALGVWFLSFLVILLIENFDSIKRNI
jgi:capsular polysaccharide biosynthesis protein